MALRAFAVAALSLLASCDFQLYFVGHQVDAPLLFEPAVLQDALRAEHGATAVQPLAGDVLSFDVTRGTARLIVACDASPEGSSLAATSGWVGKVPRDDELRAAIALQREVLQALAAKVPGFPALSAFRLEWIATENADGDALAAARERWEAAEPRP